MSIRSFFEESLSKTPDRCLFTYRRDKQIVYETYAQAAVRVKQIAEVAISKLGLTPKTSTVAIILENSSLWIETYLGNNAVALPIVPIDPKMKSEEVSYILQDSSTEVIYTDCHHIAELTEIAPQLPKVKAFVFIDGQACGAPAAIDGRPCFDLETLMTECKEKAETDTSAFNTYKPENEDIASIIYTSGTTGHPKGAMLTNGNFCSDADSALDMFTFVNGEDDFFVILPLFHSFSFTTNFIVPIRIGAGTQFATSLRTIGDDMHDFKPSIIMAVPLLVEKMHAKIEDGLRKSKIAKFIVRLGLKKILVPRIKANFGGRLRLFIVGGAPCSAKLLKAMRSLGMPIIEGYGLTEASPIVTIRPANDNHVGTIGKPIKDVEIKLADCNDAGVGELLARGPNIMKGYLNNPEATAETIDKDGWLHTGDLASMDADGFVTIRGRKKALIVNREGKNIYPEEVELCIGRDRHVLDVVVIGYTEGDEVGEKVGAIVTPNLEVFAQENGGKEPDWEKIEAKMHKIVAVQCRHLAEYKTPRKVAVYKDPLIRTSAGKVRRYKYQGSLNA